MDNANEFTAEDFKAGKELAGRWFTARHWRDVETAKARIVEILDRTEGKPFAPSQLTTGKDKRTSGAIATQAAKELAEEGIVRLVPGPRGGQYIVEVKAEEVAEEGEAPVDAADVDGYIGAMDSRDGAAYYGRSLFSTNGFDWLRLGLANRDADTIQRGVDIAYAWQDGGFPGLGSSILEDYQDWESEQLAAV